MNSSATFLIASAVVAALSVPLILKIVPPNHIYGFRIPSTLSNRELWFRANQFAGWALLIAAGASIVLLLALPESLLSISGVRIGAFLAPLLVAVVSSIAYVRKYG